MVGGVLWVVVAPQQVMEPLVFSPQPHLELKASFMKAPVGGVPGYWETPLPPQQLMVLSVWMPQAYPLATNTAAKGFPLAGSAASGRGPVSATGVPLSGGLTPPPSLQVGHGPLSGQVGHGPLSGQVPASSLQVGHGPLSGQVAHGLASGQAPASLHDLTTPASGSLAHSPPTQLRPELHVLLGKQGPPSLPCLVMLTHRPMTLKQVRAPWQEPSARHLPPS